LHADRLRTRGLPDGLRGYLLQIDEQPLDRRYLPRFAECHRVRLDLVRAAALAAGASLFQAFAAADTRPFERTAAGARLGKAVERRFLKGVLMDLLAGLDTPEAHEVLRDHWRQARNVTDRMNALAALWRSGAPDRERLLDGARAWAAPHLAGYLAYLGVVGRSPRPDVFEAVAREERQPEFRLDHPGHTRALYVPLSQNNAQLWTASGLTWLHATVVRLAPVNEATALRLLAACQLVRAMTEPLRGRVLETLAAIRGDLRVETCPSLAGRVEQYLRGPDTGA
jgi:hypothetical protein